MRRPIDEGNGLSTQNGNQPDVDVVVVGAGFAGLYLLQRLRTLGISATGIEAGGDIGGTWYWNRYPGARCDIQSIDYSYSFDPDIERSWEWSEKYATQPEILRYLEHVATAHNLRRDIRFNTSVTKARWDDDGQRWQISTDHGDTVSCRFYVMATGCLSQPKQLDIGGVDRFDGDVYFTSRWPHDGVDFAGKRVGVIGTGSSGVQSIPVIARQCESMTVFQRTPNFSIPAGNGPIPEQKLASYRGQEEEYRHQARRSRGGVPSRESLGLAFLASPEERTQRYEAAWAAGDLIGILSVYDDIVVNQASNDTLADFVREKIRSTVDDPATAELLCPNDHPFGTKRPCLDSGYYETFNLPHVELVDLRSEPITSVTETGIETASGCREFDSIVFATGFDAMTGAIVAVDIEGRDGLGLEEKWATGPKTYLGLTVSGFPNFFTVTGPGSPSVLSNMVVSIEQHVAWIGDCLAWMRDHDVTVIEPLPAAEDAWVQYVNDAADITLYPKANSWYMGSNVPDKPRVFLPFVGGVGAYREACDEVAAREYLGFRLTGNGTEVSNEGTVRPLQPDVTMLLSMLTQLEVPPIESLGVDGAREFMTQLAVLSPPGPNVGEIVDGSYPAAGGDLSYRLYRPPTDGAHPLVVYFHGGGWVLGDHTADDPFCRDLCLRADAVIVSCDYRHAPEHRFPAAADDAIAAIWWASENAAELGAIPGQLAVAGWSAGGNLAAVACQAARDAADRDGLGPEIVGQVLVTPVTDHDLTRPSMTENAEGYVLTQSLLRWFWDHYADEADRAKPAASPLRGDLANLPPALIVTSEFDPLRDEGRAYAAGLSAAGCDAQYLEMRGQIHTSLTAVDAVVSGARARVAMADALKGFFGARLHAREPRHS